VVVTLGEDAIGQRMDKAVVVGLANAGYEISRSQLARAFERGKVWHAGRSLKPGHRVEQAMPVTVQLPTPAPLDAFPEPIPIEIVHDDDDLLVIDKAPGMAVHAGPGHSRGTLVNAVLHHLGVQADQLPVLPGNEAYRPGLVHRLDRDTSGLIVLAKHQRALEFLAAQFRAHTTERSYLGLVRGVPRFDTLRVETTHARDPADRRRFAPDVPGATRRAITHVEVVERLVDAALVRFRLETGRTHQVRMHARHLGHPLVADSVYGSRPADPGRREIAERLGRHALHAAELGFAHPAGQHMRFSSELPEDMQAALRALRG
jgi:23S rRNA pseudouridine1911/1915/1917 synthase